MPALPLRLPPAPFDLDQARACARLVGEAYLATRQWEEADKPAPELFAWEPPASLAHCEQAALIWTRTKRGPIECERPVALLVRAGETATLAFRGTENPADLWVNVQVKQRDYAAPNCAGFGPVHEGFMARYLELRASLEAEFSALSAVRTLVVAGHSMGAAISTLAVPDLARNFLDLDRQHLVHYSFGSPRVGSPAFARSFDALAGARAWANAMSYRIVNTADAAVHVPPAIIERVLAEDPRYQHLGTPVSLSQNYGELSANHHHSRVYLYALEHPEDPHNAEWVRA